MYKLFIASCCPIFVLVSGIVSCSPDKKVTDVYSPPPPMIDQQGKSTSLRAWDSEPNKSLDLQDGLSFAAAQPAQVLVRTECRIDGHDYYDHFAFGPTDLVYPFQIVPEEILVNDLQRHRAECSFEINLFNGHGSNHIFNLPAVPISDRDKAQVHVEIEPATPQQALRLTVDFSEMHAVKVRFAANDAASGARVVCTDAATATLPFHSELQMDAFDFLHPQLRADRSSDALLKQPLQLCRAEILEGTRLVQISNVFDVQFPLRPIAITIGNRPLALSGFPLGRAIANIEYGNVQPLIEFLLYNPENVRRYILLHKTGLPFDLDVFLSHGGGGVFVREHFQRPWFYFSPATPPILINDNASISIVAIEPQATLHLLALFNSKLTRLNCHDWNPVGFSFTGNAGLKVQEVTRDQQVLEDLVLPLPQPLFLLQDVTPEQLPEVPAVAEICNWG